MSIGYLLRLHFRFLGCAPYFFVFPVLSALFPFFLQCFSCSFSGLCSLFSFPVRSLGYSLLGFLLFCFFCVLSDVYSATVLRLPAFPWGFSSPPRVPHLFFGLRSIFLYCLCFSSIGHPSSSSCFCIGCSVVRFCSWGCFCGSGCGSAFLSSFCFRSAFSACCSCGFSLQSFSVFFRMLQLRLLLLLLVQLLLSSLLKVRRLQFLGVRLLLFPTFILVSYQRAFAECFRISLVCFLRLRSPPWCLLIPVLV